MKIALIVVFVLVAALLVVMLVGLMLPKAHRASRAARFRESPETIWAVLIDYSKYPAWRTNLKSVEVLPAVNGMAAWREIDTRGQAIPFVIVESDAPRRMKTKISVRGCHSAAPGRLKLRPLGTGDRWCGSPRTARSTIRCSGSFLDTSWVTRRRLTRI